MDDMERYGDYNEIDTPPEKNKVLTAIKIVALVLIFSVIALLAFRLILFNYYPQEIKNIYFNDTLTAYYEKTGGDIGAKTQTLKAPYDDEKEGNFMCDHLIFIPKLGQLQISLRLNTNLYKKLAENPDIASEGKLTEESLSFRLRKSDFSSDGSDTYIDSPSVTEWKSAIMYDYAKLVFDGVDFTDTGAGYWMVLEIFVDGQKNGEKPFAEVLILDGAEDFYNIKDYTLKGSERP